MKKWHKANEMIYCAICKKIHEEKTIVKKRTVTNGQFAVRKNTKTDNTPSATTSSKNIENKYELLKTKYNLKEFKIELKRVKKE